MRKRFAQTPSNVKRAEIQDGECVQREHTGQRTFSSGVNVKHQEMGSLLCPERLHGVCEEGGDVTDGLQSPKSYFL